MKTDRQRVTETVNYLKPHIRHSPLIGFITGTGLSDTLDSLDIMAQFDYSCLPNFPVSTVESHKGRLNYGAVAGKHILMMQGRFHLYEGYSPKEVVFPIRVMQALGVKILILSNAAGGINLNFSSGDIMILSDHINLTGQTPLTGPNESCWGERFPDMAQVYDPSLIKLALEIGRDYKLPVQTGVYAGLTGPSLETLAEIRFLKTIGSDAVGFSTVMEAIAGVHAGMKILGISVITNINNPDAPSRTSLEEILQTAEKALPVSNRLVNEIVARISHDH